MSPGRPRRIPALRATRGVLAGAPFPAVVCLAMAVLAPEGSSQEPPELSSFLDALSTQAERFAEVDTAIAEGYRKLGPDFPGMGEHWIHPGLVIAGELDPRRPPVVSYTRIGSDRRLVGFAFTRVLAPEMPPPPGPFPPEAWHDHTGAVDEESLLLAGPASMHGHAGGHRLSMVHVWVPLENPAGVLKQNNWILPFVRAGLPAPEVVSSEAGRALSLAGVGPAFYEELFRVGLGLAPAEVSAAMGVLDATASDVRKWVEARRGAVAPADLAELEAAWTGLWSRLERVLSEESYRAMDVLRAGG